MNAPSNRSVLFVVGVGLVAATFTSCSDPDARYVSPQATFNTAKEAMSRNDYAAFCQCLSDEGLSLLAGSLRLTTSFIELAGQRPGADARSVQLAKELARINREHLQRETAGSANLNLNASEAELRTAVRKLAEPIQDRAGYIDAVFRVLQSGGNGARRPQFLSDSELHDVEIRGKSATAIIEGTFLEPGRSESPITFEEVNGAWKINQLGTFGANVAESAPTLPEAGMRAQIGRTRLPTSLHRAAMQGNLAAVREALEQGVDVDSRKPNLSGTALHYAAAAGHAGIVEELLKHKADIEASDTRGFTPLMLAAERGHAETVKLLLERGAEIEATPTTGEWTALCLAVAAAKSRTTAQLLLDRGAKFPEEFAGSMSRLAVELGVGLPAEEPAASEDKTTPRPVQRIANPPTMPEPKQLAPIDRPDNDGFSRLHRAAMTGDAVEIQKLFDLGADVNVRQRTFQGAPLQYAASSGKLDAVTLLLEHEAQVDAPDLQGRTPLMWAAWKGHTEVVGALLDAGADINQPNRAGWTALHFAADKGHLAAARLLLRHGASLSAKTSQGKTPLDMNPEIAPEN